MKNKSADGKNRVGFMGKLSKSLDVPPDVLMREALIELHGSSLAHIKGAGRVSLYTDTEIRFLYKGGEICVRGEGLLCSAYRRGAAAVSGSILSVSFEGGAKK